MGAGIMFDLNFDQITKSFRRDFAGSLLTAVLMAILGVVAFIAYHRATSGSFSDLFATEAQIEHKRVEATASQELALASKSNALIDLTIRILLSKYPDAARARIAVVHNGIYVSSAQIPLLRADTLWAAANAGKAAGEMTSNAPMSAWADFLPSLLVGDCYLGSTGSLIAAQTKARLMALQVEGFAACPLTNPRGEVLGALFMSWDRGSALPIDTPQLYQDMKLAAAEVSGYLQMRGSTK